MYKRHYEALAAILAAHSETTIDSIEYYGQEWLRKDVLLDKLCNWLEQENPQFDRLRFITASTS